MKVECFQEDDMRAAMAKVRAQLGEDAVLISSRRVDGRTEVMAASGCTPDQIEAEIKKLAAEKNSPSDPQPTINHVWEILGDEKETNAEAAPSLLDMQDELGRLRKLFEGELAQLSWREAGQREPNRLALMSRLETAGINREIGEKIVDKVLPCKDLELAWLRTQRLLNRVIKVSDHDALTDGGIIALIGSTGVGKTTTAAKLAAQFALIHGRHQVAFITTDSIRIGGQSQLISLGSALGIPVQVVSSGREMQKTLESFSERKLVIIDTAGVNQRDAAVVSDIESLIEENENIKPYIVLSATAQESVTNETIKAFSRIRPKAAIVTKIDECSSVGPVLSGLLRNKLPVAFIGNGQRIPEDLLPAQTELFVKGLVDSYDESRKQLKQQRDKAGPQKTLSA